MAYETPERRGKRVLNLAFGRERGGSRASRAMRDRGYEVVLAGPYTEGQPAAQAAVQEDVDAAYLDLRQTGTAPLPGFQEELLRYGRDDMKTLAHVPAEGYAEAAQYVDIALSTAQRGEAAATYLEADRWQDLAEVGPATERVLDEAGCAFGSTPPEHVLDTVEDGLGAARAERVKGANPYLFGEP